MLGLCEAAGAGAQGSLPATGGGLLLVALVLLGAAVGLRHLRLRHLGAIAIAAALAAGSFAVTSPRPAAAAPAECLLAGADAANITPFTADHPAATDVDPRSDRVASNPDGRPGGLWDQIAGPRGVTSTGLVTSSGVWGETYTDENHNRRHEEGESFTDDPVSSAIDPVSSAQSYDGIYLGGFGNDRIPRGVFDPIWARTVYVRDPVAKTSVALVSLDFIGYFGDRVPEVLARAKQLDPSFEAGAVVVAHTHDHESVDMVGLWGPNAGDAAPTDGTFPKYERYVEEKIARSLVAAFRSARPVQARSGDIRSGQAFTTLRGNREDLAGLQSRNSCRTPWLFDGELRALQLRALDGSTVATVVNWGTHVESMEDANQYLSSDFPNAARQQVEQVFGGVAVYVPGAQGAVEVVGDSCLKRWRRDSFDGERYPVDADSGRPLVLQDKDGEYPDPLAARNRTYALGRVVGSAAVTALRSTAFEPDARLEVLPPTDVYVPSNNGALLALVAAGTIDKPSYTGAEHQPVSATDIAKAFGTGLTPPSGLDVKTTLFAWRLGRASFVTAPGELFPELYYGLDTANRSLPNGDYGRVNPAALACAARPFAYSDDPNGAGASTGRPAEPAVRPAQVARFHTPVNFLLGYAPDLLGYIVPGGDFSWFVPPAVEGVGLGALVGEAPDPCRELPPDLAFPDARYGTHYQETNSAGSMLAPAVTCAIAELLHGPTATAANGACQALRAWRNGVVTHVGVGSPVFAPGTTDAPVGHY